MSEENETLMGMELGSCWVKDKNGRGYHFAAFIRTKGDKFELEIKEVSSSFENRSVCKGIWPDTSANEPVNIV